MRITALWMLLLVVYHAIAFLIPFVHTPMFWLSYGFTLLAIIVQLPLLHWSFRKGTRLSSKLYGFPIARVGAIYLAVQIILGIAFMSLNTLIPLWTAALAQVLIFALAAAGLLTTETMRSEIQKMDERLHQNVSAMRALQSRVSVLRAQFPDIPPLKALADELNYSDPVSSEATRELETHLAQCVGEMEAALSGGDPACTRALCEKMHVLLIERNRLCKLNK